MELKAFAGSAASDAFLAELVRLLPIVSIPRVTQRFNDGEVFAQFPESVRRADVYLVQPTCQPDGNLQELLVMIDAARRASAGEITAVIPYFGYARQDRKVQPRVPITAKLNCDLLNAAGANRVLTADIHAGQIQGFFDGPFDNLEVLPRLLRQVRREHAIDFREAVFVSPDDGGLERCRETAKLVECSRVTFVMKYHPEQGVTEVHGVRDPELVRGRTCLLIDDLADTFGTMEKAAAALVEAGATRVIALCVHPVLSTDRKSGESALARLERSLIERLYVADTIPLRMPSPKITVVSVADVFARAIAAIHSEGSVHRIFSETCDEITTKN